MVGAIVVVTAGAVVLGAMVGVGATVVVTTGTVVVGATAVGENNEYANKFGLLAPMLNNAPAVADDFSFSSTCACVSEGFSCSIMAAMPLTIGAAFDVPLLDR